MARNRQAAEVSFARREFFGAEYTPLFPFADMPLSIVDQLYESGRDTGRHKHEDFYALYVVSAGQGLHDINGHPYSVRRGDVYIAAPGSVHAYRDYEQICAVALCFQTELFSSQQLEALRSLSGFWNLRVDDADSGSAGTGVTKAEVIRRHRLHLSPEQLKSVEAMVDELRGEVQRRHENTLIARALIPQLFFRLLVHLARTQEQQAQGVLPTANDSGLAQVLRICEEHFAEPLSVPQLAAAMFLSPGRFSEVFSAQMGVAPATYIRRLRLERAQTLLRTTELTAAHIAVEVGFADAAQFSRAFRSAFGLTPSDYRASFRK